MSSRSPTSAFRRLDPARVGETAAVLAARVAERFPGSSLAEVARELTCVCSEAEELSRWLAGVDLRMRGLTLAGFVLLVALPFYGLLHVVDLRSGFESITDVIQTLEAAVNDIVFIGIAAWFLLKLEARAKRERALSALHVLRSMAHIIDMHQLTKDPERVLGLGGDTASSPKRLMNAFELTRYLDYCSEMLALLSKVAAIYVEDFKDAETLRAVQEIEDLSTGLARKIWQKIIILDRVVQPAGGPSA